LRALPPPLDPTKTDNDFGRFIFAPLGEYVARHGRGPADFSASLAALEELTKRFSMEFAIRDFINHDPVQTLTQLAHWARSDNYHVRRLASEGSRPRLPWAVRVSLAPEAAVPLLDQLHADPTRLVTRSVANHLNDITKTEPDLVIAALMRWRALGRQDKSELDWMTRHALRTLVKQGHTGALSLLGYASAPQITIGKMMISPANAKVTRGDSLTFSFEITATADENLMIDYVVDFVKANGKSKPKVFKLKKMKMTGGQTVILRKTHRFLQNATTFRLYPGRHHLSLQINGMRQNTVDFTLE
jgi:3-methyladenine DNA glycosylase AlkC